MAFDDKTSVLNVLALSDQKKEQEGRAAVFMVLTGSQAGRMYKLERDILTIGRGSAAAIRINDEGVSRNHAKIIKGADGSVALQDLGSTNGTLCNGDKIDVMTLSDGDKIQIGTTTILKFSYQDSLEEEFSRRQYESVTRDALTACYNKKYLLERLPNEFAFASRHQKPLSLAMFDIDFFKKINDTYGHLAGDHVLKVLAGTVQNAIRADDVLARYGGEEFAIIMRETGAEPAFIACERVRRDVEAQEFQHDGKEIRVSVSIGVATYHEGNMEDSEALIKSADEFLYKAKRGGRNRTECALL